MVDNRTSAIVQAEIDQLHKEIGELGQQREDIIQRMADNWGKENPATLERQLPGIASRQEAARRRVLSLQAELNEIAFGENLALYEECYKRANVVLTEMVEIDEQIVGFREQIELLVKRKGELNTIYGQGIAVELGKLKAKLREQKAAEFKQIDKALYERYKVGKYL